MMESEHKQDARTLIFGRGAVRRARATLAEAVQGLGADKSPSSLSAAERFVALWRGNQAVKAAALLLIADAIAEHAQKARPNMVSPWRLPEARSAIASVPPDLYDAANRITVLTDRLAQEFRKRGGLAAERFLSLAADDPAIAEDALRTIALSAGSAA